MRPVRGACFLVLGCGPCLPVRLTWGLKRADRGGFACLGSARGMFRIQFPPAGGIGVRGCSPASAQNVHLRYACGPAARDGRTLPRRRRGRFQAEGLIGMAAGGASSGRNPFHSVSTAGENCVPFLCPSSPHRKRFAGLRRGPQKKGRAFLTAPALGGAAGASDRSGR